MAQVPAGRGGGVVVGWVGRGIPEHPSISFVTEVGKAGRPPGFVEGPVWKGAAGSSMRADTGGFIIMVY